jgi:hypothetical protein
MKAGCRLSNEFQKGEKIWTWNAKKVAKAQQ